MGNVTHVMTEGTGRQSISESHQVAGRAKNFDAYQLPGQIHKCAQILSDLD